MSGAVAYTGGTANVVAGGGIKPAAAGLTLWHLRDFGRGRGDGVTNDQSAYLRCLEQAVAKGGGVYFPAGHWRLTEMFMRSGVPHVGAGWRRTKLQPHPTSAAEGFVTLDVGPVQGAQWEGMEIAAAGIAGQHAFLLKSQPIVAAPYHGGLWNSSLANLYLHDWLGETLWLWGGGIDTAHGNARNTPHQFLELRNILVERAARRALRMSGQVGQVEVIGGQFDGIAMGSGGENVLIERSRQVDGVTYLDDLAPYTINFRGVTFQERDTAVRVERAAGIHLDGCYWEDTGCAVSADVSSDVLVTRPLLANAAAMPGGLGRGFKAVGSSMIRVRDPYWNGNVDRHYEADNSSRVDVTCSFGNGITKVTTAGLTSQMNAAATMVLGLRRQVLVNTSATAITNIDSTAAPGEFITLKAFGGTITLNNGAGAGAISLGGFAGPLVIASGAWALLQRADLTGDYVVISRGS